ncbi:MAG: pyridoxamine 5'-phosphate oxidase family protein [Propionibacterium sp.]
MHDEIHRKVFRASHERAKLDALLDSQRFGTLSAVGEDGEPWAVPMGFARVGDLVVVHGSTGGGLLRAAAGGARTVLTVATTDGYVVGFSAEASSVNYRSATIRGCFSRVEGDEKPTLLDAYTNFFFPGRSEEIRPHTARELAATMLLTLPIDEDNWLYKERTGQAVEPDEQTGAWGGVVGIRTVPQTPERAPWSQADEPESVRRLVAQINAGRR